MANIIPTSLKSDLGSAKIDWVNDTMKMMLLSSSATPSASWAKRSDVTNEITGTNYSAGGVSLTTKAINASGNNKDYTSDAVSWATATFTCRYGVIYKSRGGASSADELIKIIDFGADKSPSAGTFTVTPSANGWIEIQ